MIGYRKYDIVGVNNAGIDSICVTYGYGSYEEIYKAAPTYIAESVPSIGNLLL